MKTGVAPAVFLSSTDLAFVEALNQAVAVKGEDYIRPAYTGCVYTDEAGAPSCILGWAYHIMTGQTMSTNWNLRFSQEYKFYPALRELTQPVITSAEFAQTLQDKGSPWGYVLDKFSQRLRFILEG